MAVPVIATDWGGPTDYLDSQCGILVAPTSTEHFIQGLASAMRTLAASPSQCMAMGAAGRMKVLAEFDWEVKVDRMLLVYRSVVTDGASRQAAAPSQRHPVAS
jgi:glycosyltransferase involved in cell wall biosynthesis